MIVFGTAGHIDHGKSSIVKRLTGTDPDRLPEEKKRGMTIDLGFAFYKTPDNDTIAFVDVPGHERFVKNMIAGAGGIDAVMLVVAADDGWMPQTEEHFQIVRLLGVKHGLIVINKCDLANSKTIEILRKEIEHKVVDSFLSNAPIFEVSSVTGHGFDKLCEELNSTTKTIMLSRDIGKARLYIDRVFIRQGIGAVATGTLKDGTLSAGQTITLWPPLKQYKIKTLQSNNQDVTAARPGQRTAVSLSGAGKEILNRGKVISAQTGLDMLKSNPVLAVRAELLKNSPVPITNRRKVTLMVGTTESEAEIRLADTDKILPGGSGIVLVKPDEDVLAMIGDNVIFRLPTPMVTIGGGVVLDHLPIFPKKKELPRLKYLELRNVFDPSNLVFSEIKKLVASKTADLLRFSYFKNETIQEYIEQFVESGKCGYSGDYVVDKSACEEISNQLLSKMSKVSAQSGQSRGFTVAEITKHSGIDSKVLVVLLNILISEKKLESKDDRYFLRGEREKVTPEIETLYNNILSKVKADSYAPPSITSLVTDGKSSKEAIRLLIKNNEVHKCGSEFLFTQFAWNNILDFIRATLKKQNELKVGELRDKFMITRKHAIPILEETDRLRITKRNGDVRIKGSNFES